MRQLNDGDIVSAVVRVNGIYNEESKSIDIISGQSISVDQVANTVFLGNKSDHKEEFSFFRKSVHVKAIQYCGDSSKIDNFCVDHLGYEFISWEKNPMRDGDWIVLFFARDGGFLPVIKTNESFLFEFEV